MTTTTAETPDGERLARLETRAEHLELQVSEIRQDIRDLRTEMRGEIRTSRTEHGGEIRASRTEHREDFLRLEAQIQALRQDTERQFRWMVGIVITVGLSIIALGAGAFFTVLNRIEA